MHWWRWTWLAGTVAWLACGLTAGEQDSSQPAKDGFLESAAADLADANGRVRERAARLLWSAGGRAQALLKQAAESGDPEAAMRARRILADIEDGILPNTPGEIAGLLRSYRTGDLPTKKRVLEELLGLGERAYPALARLSAREADAGIRSEIFKRLSGRSSLAAGAFIAEGDFRTAELLLRAGLTNNTNESARNHALFAQLTGKAIDEITRLRPILDAARPLQQDARALCFLLRATGDLKGARLAAERSQDPQLLEEMLLEADDWTALARLYDQKPKDADHLALAATFKRLSGDPGASDQFLQLMQKDRYDDPRDLWQTVKAHLVNEQFAVAATPLERNGERAQALRLRAARQAHQDVLDMTTPATMRVTPQRPEAIDELLYVRAATLHSAGRTTDALATLDEAVGRMLAEASTEKKARLIEAEREMGLSGRALEHAAQALVPAPTTAEVVLVLGALFPDEPQAAHWHRLIRSEWPKETERQRLQRLETLLAGATPANDLRLLLVRVSASCTGLSSGDASAVLESASRLAIKSRGVDLLRKALRRLHEQTYSPVAAAALAKLALHEKDWLEAASYFQIAVRHDPLRAELHWLLGFALHAMGRVKEGEQAMRVGTLLPLGDAKKRLELVEALRSAGLRDEAAVQLQLAVQSGDPRSWEYGNALRMLARHAHEQKDYARAARFWERAMLEVLRPQMGFANAADYPAYAAMICRTRALALVAAGKLDDAGAEARRAQRFLPGDLSTGILVGLAMAKHDRMRADELYRATRAHQEAILNQFPRSAEAHNSLAWLMARLRRDLPAALQHAKAAAALQPETAAIRDTLAEVHFQLGQREEAMKAMYKCVELEPLSQRHRAQLERILHGSPDSDPPDDVE